MSGRPKQEDDLPLVAASGIHTMPKKVIDHRSSGNRGNSAWPSFLDSLEVGQSFLVPYCELGSIQTHAKKLSIDLVHALFPGSQNKYRVWIYGREGERNPLYFRHEGQLFKAEPLSTEGEP